MNKQNDLSPYRKRIFAIAIPAIFEALVLTFVTMIDQKMVSALGTAAISAVSVTNQPRLFLLCFFTSLQIVLSSLVAVDLGKEDRDHANRLFLTSVLVTLLAALVLGIGAALAADPIMELCSGQRDTMESSVIYFRILMLGTPFSTLYAMVNAGLRGCGKTKVTFYSNLVSCLVNIFFNFLLIEGHWGFPRLGIFGAALATVIGFAAALVFSTLYLVFSGSFLSLSYCRRSAIRPSTAALREIAAKWRHTFLQDILSRAGMLASSALAARIGSYEMAIYSLGMNWMNVNYAFGSGFQTAGMVLIGKSRGADCREDADVYTRLIKRIGRIMAFALAVLIVLLAKPYYAAFSDDAEFVRIGFWVGIVVAVIAPIQISKFAHTGFLLGYGNMKLPMISAVISVTALQPVCEYIFIFLCGMGIEGVFLSVLFSQTCWMVTTRIFHRNACRKLSAPAEKN